MANKESSKDFTNVLTRNGIKKLYHFTDRDNLQMIIQNGGLYSWADCEEKGIKIPKPGGGQLSREPPTLCKDLLHTATPNDVCGNERWPNL